MCYDPEWTQRQGSVIWVRSGRDQRGACGLVQFHRLQISRRRFVTGHPTHIKINTDEGLECWNLDERAAWAGLGYHLLRQSLLPVPAGVL